MKTIIFTYIALCIVVISHANNFQTLDTLYANDRMNVALFFPSDIRQAVTGSENIIFTYNREYRQNLGLLKAIPKASSNLLVITTDGKVYSYIIEYALNLNKLNYFLSVSESIGHEKKNREEVSEKAVPKKSKKPNTGNSKIEIITKEEYILQKSCAALLKLPERENKIKRSSGISLSVKNKVYHKGFVYIQFEIKNRSGIDFDVDLLEIYKVSGTMKRKSSYQERLLVPVLKYNLPKKIKHGHIARFVYVLPKFTLDKNEKVQVKLKEHQGRSLSLKF